MAQAHYNYYPPSGAVLDQNEPKAYWNGKEWQKNKKKYAIPSGHRLVGRVGGALDGWYYDWHTRAWMEPDKKSAPSASPVPARATAPQPPASKPQPKKEEHMEKCDHNHEHHSRTAEIMEVVKVISYIVGPIAVAVGASLKAPNRPTVSPDQPQWLIDENQNRFTENNASWESRKGVWTNVGQALLTFGSSGLSKADREEIGNIVRGVVHKAA